jgi:endoglucanase
MRDRGLALLKACTEAAGAPGSEHQVRRIITREIPGEHRTDNCGNTICDIPGGSEGPRVLLEAHMDEVGFMVQSLTDDGFLRFVTLGGWWPHVLLAQRVRVSTANGAEILGVVTSKPPHFLSAAEREKVMKVDNLYIDVGASSADELRETFGIEVGDPIVPDSAFTQLHDPDMLLAKAFDNRVGCAAGIHACELLSSQNHPNQLTFVGAVQEELGTRGAQPAMRSAEPDVAIVLEGTPADDVPGSGGTDARQGALRKGPQVRIMDPSAMMNRPLVNLVRDTAVELEIPLQVAVRRSGGTDARPIHLHGQGVPTVVIGVPARYIHTHSSIIYLPDYLHTVELICELVRRLDAETVASLTDFS